MTPVRVLHVLEAIEGGTARHVVDVVRSVQGVEHHVAVPTVRRGGGTDALAIPAMHEASAAVRPVDMRRDPLRVANAVAVARVARLIRSSSIDLVHAHSSIGGLVGRVAARVTRVPCVYTPHAVTDHRVGVAVERRLGPLTNMLVAVSESERAQVLELGLVPPERVTVIPNGIDVETEPGSDVPNLRRQFGIAADAPLAGSISRLVAQKAPEDLVAAWATAAMLCPDAHFVLIGGGQLQGEFTAAIRQTNLEHRIHQIATLPNAAAVLDQLDVFSLASLFEGAPYALLEAMRSGTPIVATDVVGTRDTIEHDASGLLAPARSPVELGRLIGRVLTDRPLGARLAGGAHQRLRERYDITAMSAALHDLYQRQANGPRRPISHAGD